MFHCVLYVLIGFYQVPGKGQTFCTSVLVCDFIPDYRHTVSEMGVVEAVSDATSAL